jgi:hypothetical protein
MARNNEAHSAFYAARDHFEGDTESTKDHPLMASLNDPSKRALHEEVREFDALAGGTSRTTLGPTLDSPISSRGNRKRLPKKDFPRKLYRPGMKMAWDD